LDESSTSMGFVSCQGGGSERIEEDSTGPNLKG
jgi:hypothetical protein